MKLIFVNLRKDTLMRKFVLPLLLLTSPVDAMDPELNADLGKNICRPSTVVANAQNLEEAEETINSTKKINEIQIQWDLMRIVFHNYLAVLKDFPEVKNQWDSANQALNKSIYYLDHVHQALIQMNSLENEQSYSADATHLPGLNDQYQSLKKRMWTAASNVPEQSFSIVTLDEGKIDIVINSLTSIISPLQETDLLTEETIFYVKDSSKNLINLLSTEQKSLLQSLKKTKSEDNIKDLILCSVHIFEGLHELGSGIFELTSMFQKNSAQDVVN